MRPPVLLEGRGVLVALALLIALLFAATNLPWTLDNYDQAKQAFTSFEMVQQGHWLYQHTPNEKIATKPPLVGWISAAIYGLSRNWEVAWRLPSFVAAAALAFLLTRAAGRAYGALPATLALAAFGLNLLSPRLATLVRTDMPLALVVCLLGWKIWSKIRSGVAWQTRDRVMFFALLTAAMLIKGPIVYAFLLPGLITFEWWRRRRTPEVAGAWCGWWPWIASLAIFGTWTAGGIALVPCFYEQVVLKEFAGRFGESVHRSQPLYFYFPHLLHKFAPWSLLLAALVVWQRRRSRWPAEVMWLVFWSAGGLIVMSLVPSKRVDRIFPIVPALCLLLAALTAAALQELALRDRVRRWGGISLGVACLFTGGYAVQRVVASYRAGDGALLNLGEEVRRTAATQGWRYEVIGGKEEGLLLYLRRDRFLKIEEAVERWNAGGLDAVVAPAEDLPKLLASLPGAAVGLLQGSVTIDARPRRYVVLQRPAP